MQILFKYLIKILYNIDRVDKDKFFTLQLIVGGGIHLSYIKIS